MCLIHALINILPTGQSWLEAVADLSLGMHRLLPVCQNREIIVFIMNYVNVIIFVNIMVIIIFVESKIKKSTYSVGPLALPILLIETSY